MNAKPKKKPRFSCLRCCSIVLVGVLVLVLVPGLLLYFVAAPRMHARIAEIYPAPGQIFEVYGSKMHIYCEGQGSQTVIIMNGMDEQSQEWRDVQAKLAGYARVCLYDRLGHQWSGSTFRARTAENIADELKALVKAAGIAPGFVLVGYGETSVYARMFAWRYPNQPGALLLVNPLVGSPSVTSAVETTIVVMGLAASPPLSIVWLLSEREALSGAACPSWLVDGVCTAWQAWAQDAYAMQTKAFEALSLGPAMRTLLEPGTQYGDLPIILLETEYAAHEDAELDRSDILGRTTNGRVQTGPGDTLIMIHESPQSLVDAVKALLH